jgi:hypothetical protein
MDPSDGHFVFVPGSPRASQPYEEKKTVILPHASPPPLSLSLRRGALSSLGLRRGRTSGGWENYSVRLVKTGTISSAAGTGVVAVSFLLDPTSLPLYEWSTFAGLFDEVKCTHFEVWISPVDIVGTSLTQEALSVGSFTRTTSTPVSQDAVAVAPDSVLISPLNTSALGYCHKMNVPKDILFAATASPAPGPYAGCPGSVQVYGVTAPGITAFNFMVVGRYHLRGRL